MKVQIEWGDSPAFQIEANVGRSWRATRDEPASGGEVEILSVRRLPERHDRLGKAADVPVAAFVAVMGDETIQEIEELLRQEADVQAEADATDRAYDEWRDER